MSEKPVSEKVNPVDEEHKGLLPISEKEHLLLILEAEDGKAVSAKFGPGWVALEPIPSNRWAILRVADMRGIVIAEQKTERE